MKTTSEVGDLIYELGMIDEGVAVVLPVQEDIVVSLHLDVRNGIVLVPVTEVFFHERSQVPLIVARSLAAFPHFPVCDREVEISAC